MGICRRKSFPLDVLCLMMCVPLPFYVWLDGNSIVVSVPDHCLFVYFLHILDQHRIAYVGHIKSLGSLKSVK